MTICSIPWASASSPHRSQYRAEALSSPSIMVEPWENKWTGDNASGGGAFGVLLAMLGDRVVVCLLTDHRLCRLLAMSNLGEGVLMMPSHPT